jgi:glycosyltransferase involved in cell wall biosynthesis
VAERRLRIAVLGTRGFPNVQGGIERHCENLYAWLVRRGCKVRVYTRKSYGDPNAGLVNGVERYPLWAPRSRSLEAIVHTFLGVMHLALRKNEFDILHIHAVGPSLLTPLARMLGMRVVITNHGADYERKKWGAVAKRVLMIGERWGTRYANAVIAVARHIQERLERQYRRPVHYVPNGIPALRKQPPGELLQRFNLEQGRYILAVGRIVPEKGFHDLLKAFAALETTWKLVITGEADHRDDYSKDLIRQAQKQPQVVLTGRLAGKDIEEVYSHAGIFVLPSYHEGLPLTLLEALSYGLPVLASDIQANRELIDDRSRTFSPGDSDRLSTLLASDIKAIMDNINPAAVDTTVLAEFNWERIAERTLAVYKEALA